MTYRSDVIIMVPNARALSEIGDMRSRYNEEWQALMNHGSGNLGVYDGLEL